MPEVQCGCRPGRSTIDMMFAVRQAKEKCIEQQTDLYSMFIVLTKAFDTVNREAPWTILAKLGCPCKFTTLVRLFYSNMTGQVFCNGDCTNYFNISNGMKQDCLLALVLVNLFFFQVQLHTVKDLDLGVYVRYRSDGSALTSSVSLLQPRPWKNSSLKPYLRMTVPSWHTGKITCRQLQMALQRHQGSLDRSSALGKRRS